MPFRSISTLQAWLKEFENLGYAIPGSLRVIQQDGDDGADTGLVVFDFDNATTTAYIQPGTPDAAHWAVTMEPREGAITMTAAKVQNLAAELSVLSALCAFLQAKSQSLLDRNRG